jgi:hypothetical protein
MIIENFAEMKKQLAELSTVLNAFKSEAVQLRLLDLIFGEDEEVASAQAPNSETNAVKRRKRKPKTKTPADDSAASTPAKRKQVSSGTGALATLNRLVDEKFFDKPRTISDIIGHCKNDKAQTFKPNDISGKLIRLVRSKKLNRQKNTDNQYAYSKA